LFGCLTALLPGLLETVDGGGGDEGGGDAGGRDAGGALDPAFFFTATALELLVGRS